MVINGFASPSQIEKNFYLEVKRSVNRIAVFLNERLTKAYARFEKGKTTRFCLDIVVKANSIFDADFVSFYNSATVAIAEELAENYRDNGWNVELTFSDKGANVPTLIFSLPEEIEEK